MHKALKPQIGVRSISKYYRQGQVTFTAVDNINLDVMQGEFLVITGRSGAGKSTLLSLMGGLVRPSSGMIYVDGVDIKSLDDSDLSAMHAQKIGFVFQFASLFPTLTVLENVQLPSLFASKPVDANRARDLLQMVGLSGQARSYPSQLSGGQQRRVAVARALMNQPEILLADEPTGDLDVATEIEVLELFRSLNAQGMTILLVTHNPDLAMYGNRSCTMEQGRLIENKIRTMPPKELKHWETGIVFASSYS